ncbi:MAG: hypothetical protein IKC22_07060 [Bacilli bacterium]|nr:hypothetical protein [Bacilli bacterium]
MAKLVYGKRNKLNFRDYGEFYKAYGFLCNSSKHSLKVMLEYNARSGAWGNEGRILLYKHSTTHYTPLPQAFYNKLTAGRGRIINRINCNEYVLELYQHYGFSVSNTINGITPSNLTPPSLQDALTYVPVAYQNDFLQGYNM